MSAVNATEMATPATLRDMKLKENVRNVVLALTLVYFTLVCAELVGAILDAGVDNQFVDGALAFAAAVAFLGASAVPFAAMARMTGAASDALRVALLFVLAWLLRAVVRGGFVAAVGRIDAFNDTVLASFALALAIFAAPAHVAVVDVGLENRGDDVMGAAALALTAPLYVLFSVCAVAGAGADDIFLIGVPGAGAAASVQIALLVLALAVPLLHAVHEYLKGLPSMRSIFVWDPVVGVDRRAMLLYWGLAVLSLSLYVGDAAEALRGASLRSAADRALVLPFILSLVPVAVLQVFRPLLPLPSSVTALVVVACARSCALLGFRVVVESERLASPISSAGKEALVVASYVGGLGFGNAFVHFPVVLLSLADEIELPDLLSFGFSTVRRSLNTLQIIALVLQAGWAAFLYTKRKRVDEEQIEHWNRERVERELKMDQVARSRHLVVLIIGGPASGEAAIFHDIEALYGSRRDGNVDERRRYAEPVRQFVFGQLRKAAVAAGVDGDSIPPMPHFAGVLDEVEVRHVDGVALRVAGDVDDVVNSYVALWENWSVVDEVNRAGHLETLEYFMADRNCLRRMLVDPEYVPSGKCVMMFDQHGPNSKNVYESHLSIEGNDFILVNATAGVRKRASSKKWLHMLFEDRVEMLIFVASLSEYDHVSFEDESRNRMDEALNLFKEITSMSFARGVSIMVLLNNTDLFAEKIQAKPLRGYYPDYEGPDGDWEDAAIYIENMFRERYTYEPGRDLYVHQTCATDTNAFDSIFSAIKDVILRRSLQEGGLLL